MRDGRLLAILAVLACAPAALGAQFAHVPVPPQLVDSGARIRVDVASSAHPHVAAARVDRFSGTIIGLARDTLYLNLSGIGPASIPRDRIRRVQRSLGRSKRASAIEVGVLTAMIYSLNSLDAHHDPDSRRYDAAWQAVAVGGALGFAFGAYLGHAMAYERWRPARLPDLR